MNTHETRILALAFKRGVIRASELDKYELPRVALTRLVRKGMLERIAHGLYAAPDRNISEHSAFAEVAKKYPQSVICLLSALRFHELTTQAPFEVWVAIANKTRSPKMEYPPLRVIRFSGPLLHHGVKTHKIDGVSVRITSVARTVADCFKYRNKIGLDVALEALTEAKRKKLASMDDIWKAAIQCRVANVMRPYMESLA
jgi:predicted transcriptional regulator of viral defense system